MRRCGQLGVGAVGGQRDHEKVQLATVNAPPLLNAQLASTAVSLTGGCALLGSARVGTVPSRASRSPRCVGITLPTPSPFLSRNHLAT